jgi:thiol-disulfide isomerase/thioredoxin
MARRPFLGLSVAMGLWVSADASWAEPPAGFVLYPNPLETPKITFQAGSGRKLVLDDFLGRVVLLNLWATWCAPCRAEMPTLDNLQAILGGSDFEVLALSLDQGGVQDVERFYRELDLRHLAVYVDPTTRAQRELRVFGLPTTLLIDADGRELGRLIGPTDWDSYEMVSFLRSFIDRRSGREDILIEETKNMINTKKEMMG